MENKDHGNAKHISEPEDSPGDKSLPRPKQIPPAERFNVDGFFNHTFIRFISIGLIALLMLIPFDNVSSLINSRHTLYNSVLEGIASQWGRPQIIAGPVLVLPIVEKHFIDKKIKMGDGSEKIVSKPVLRRKNIVILPKQLHNETELDGNYRYRSIYKSLVYQAESKVNGSFIIPDPGSLSEHLFQIEFEKAFLAMSLSDTKAINNVSPLEFGGESSSFNPGLKVALKGFNSGFNAPVSLTKEKKEYLFSFSFGTKGSSSIRFAPFGETSNIRISSSWPHPSFQGNILPTHRNIHPDGFDAQWAIPSLTRNYPQAWILENKNFSMAQLLVGVNLYEPVFLYSLLDRAVKYGIMFIGLTFAVFVMFEMVNKTRLHFIQYILIGLSLAMFYLLLLSLSEHIDFDYAYLAASAVAAVSITVYTWYGGRKKGPSITIFIFLCGLYAILHAILQLEDYALLMGTGLLLVILLALMWTTRNLKVEPVEKNDII